MSSTDENTFSGTNSADAKKKSNDSSSGHSSDKGKRKQEVDSTSQKNANKPGESEEENASRMNAAKAFFRAMYAGEEVDAGQFGMNVETMNPASGNAASAGQVEQAEARANEMEGLYKRMAADFENYRRRVEREREELLGLGMQKAIEAILPALDDLDRAQTSFNNNSDSANVLESLKLISARFNKCLEQLGIKPLDAMGQPFDPRLHEPVQQVVAEHVPEGAVADDLRRGYVMGDKVIRPALVNVAIGEAEEGTLEDTAQSDVETGDHGTVGER